MTTTDRQFCSLCNLSIHLSDWVIGDDGNPAHARPARCIALLREEVERQSSLIDSLTLDLGLESRALAEARARFSAFLERVGAYVKADGTIGLSSEGFADWRKRKGNALLEDEIDELRSVVAVALKHITGTHEKFSEREELAVVYQLRKALEMPCAAQIKPVATSLGEEVGK